MEFYKNDVVSGIYRVVKVRKLISTVNSHWSGKKTNYPMSLVTITVSFALINVMVSESS